MNVRIMKKKKKTLENLIKINTSCLQHYIMLCMYHSAASFVWGH